MQQRLFDGFDVEIAGLQQQRDIGQKSRAGESVAAELRKGQRQHPEPAQHQCRAEHHDQRREDAPDAPVVETDQAETAEFLLAHDDARDQEARDHEEHVDADEAARHGVRESVEIQDQHHGDGPEAVDIRPIF